MKFKLERKTYKTAWSVNLLSFQGLLPENGKVRIIKELINCRSTSVCMYEGGGVKILNLNYLPLEARLPSPEINSSAPN